MAGNLHRFIQTLVLGFVCLLVMVPAELHGTLVEVGAHDVQGTVSVDARHADQKAHFEHSTVVVHSLCAACVLTQKSEALSLLPDVGHPRTPQIGTHPSSDPCCLDPRSDRHTPSRAPPLF